MNNIKFEFKKVSTEISLVVLTIQIMIFSPNSTQAQIQDKFSPGIHNHKGTELPFQIFVPQPYDSSIQYPLILHLHGAGSRGTDNIIQIDRPAVEFFVSDSNQSKHPAFILAPQCPKNQQWVDFPWKQGNYIQDSIPESNELMAVEDMLDSIINSHSIDTNRLYAIGESMGGFGTWDIVTRNPNKFAATIPVVGAGDPSKMHLIQHMAIWGFHGTADQSVPVTGTRNMIKTLDSLGVDIFYTNCNPINCDGVSKENVEIVITSDFNPRHIYSEFEGVDHGLWATFVHKFDGLYNWLFSFSKPISSTLIETNKYEKNDGIVEWNGAHSNQDYFQFSVEMEGFYDISIFDILGNLYFKENSTGKQSFKIFKNDLSIGINFIRIHNSKIDIFQKVFIP